MSHPQTAADRRAYLEADLTALACDRCAAEVRVRKTSPAQTTVQWTLPAAGRCVEFEGRPVPARSRTCPALRESIERAVREGRLGVASRAGS